MLRDETVVGDAAVPHRTPEDAAHRHLALSTIAQPSNRVAGVAERVSTIVHQSFGSAVALDERPYAACAPPPVRALAAGVGAVDAAAPGAVQVGDGCRADGAIVLPDDIARHVDLLDVEPRSTHVPIMTMGCPSVRRSRAGPGGEMSKR